MSSLLFDTHAHYTDSKFEDPVSLLKQLFETDVCGVMCCGWDVNSSKDSLNLAKQFPGMFSSAGIHPENCTDLEDMNAALDEVKKLCSDDKVKALGEIGLDYYWDIPKKKQLEYFDAQLCLAEELDIPVIIHDRDAHGDVFDLIRSHKKVRGVMHGYSGSAESARQYANMGFYISFPGTITFKNAARLPEVVGVVPLDRIVVETDCPYLTPVPYRGQMNHSGYIKYTAGKVAELLKIDYNEFCSIEVVNAKKLFNI
ncbi:MAG: TatD family hydrolase [Clostridiales bacterium]|nr:TatD family hydrolase [Clostridiales bacterium]